MQTYSCLILQSLIWLTFDEIIHGNSIFKGLKEQASIRIQVVTQFTAIVTTTDRWQHRVQIVLADIKRVYKENSEKRLWSC